MAEIKEFTGVDPTGAQTKMSKLIPNANSDTSLEICSLTNVTLQDSTVVEMDYTITMWLKSAESDPDAFFELYVGNKLIGYDTISTSWKKYIYSFSSKSNDVVKILFDVVQPVLLWHTKLERGLLSTEWDMSSNDMASLKVDHDSIAMEVRSLDGEELATRINLNSNTAKINAQHVDITGIVTFDSFSDTDKAKLDNVIVDDTTFYKASDNGVGIEFDEDTVSTWSTNPDSAKMTKENPYLWCGHRIVKASDTDTYIYNEPFVCGTLGEDGTSVSIKGRVDDKTKLPTTATDGDGYITSDDGHLWTYSSASNPHWIDCGEIKGDKGDSVSLSEPLYYRTSSSTTPTKPTEGASGITETSADISDAWTLSKPTLNATDKLIFTCYQTKIGNIYKYTYPALDASLSAIAEWCKQDDEGHTLIDGGSIYTKNLTAENVLVKDADGNDIFNANGVDKIVKIGGFNVASNGLSCEDEESLSSILLSNDCISCYSPYASANMYDGLFNVTDENELHITSMSLNGFQCSYDEDKFSSINFNGMYTTGKITASQYFTTTGNTIIHSGNITNYVGTRYNLDSSTTAPSKTVKSGTWTDIMTITIPSNGIYIMSFNATFSSNKNGYREIKLIKPDGTDYGYIAHDISPAIDGAATTCAFVIPNNFIKNATYTLRAYQNSGSALTVTPRMYSVKVSNATS